MSVREVSKAFHRTDDVLKGFTFGYFMVQLQQRKIRLTPDRVRDLFGHYLKQQIIEAKQIFEDNFDELMEMLDSSQRKEGFPR